MKRRLILGLLVLILTNLILFAGVWMNRTGQVTSELTLTERELSLPYINFSAQENSGVALQIEWRVPIREAHIRYHYQRSVDITKTELEILSFHPEKLIQKSNALKKELYWVLELNGELYQKQLSITENHYQTFLTTFSKDSDKEQHRMKEHLEDRLSKEKIQSSRLFFLDIAQNLEQLIEKYINQKNALIVKGQVRPSYDKQTNIFKLHLHSLSNPSIMLTRDQTMLLNGLKSVDNKMVNPPRYSAEVKWGSRFEPWVISLKKLVD